MPKKTSELSEKSESETFPVGLYLYSGEKNTLTFMARSTTPDIIVMSEKEREEEKIEWNKKNDPAAVPKTVKEEDWTKISIAMATNKKIITLGESPANNKLLRAMIMEEFGYPAEQRGYIDYLFENRKTFAEEN